MGYADPAVVVGLDCVTGLQTARILAARGVPVIGVARDPRHYCARTRVCREVLAADTTPGELVGALAALLPRLDGPAVLFPCTDAAVLTLSRHRGALHPHYRLVLPSAAVVELLADKLAFWRHAADQGLPIPRTAVLLDRTAAEAVAATFRFPLVLKPPLTDRRWRAATGEKAYRTATPQELLATYDRIAGWADRLVAQEWVAGDTTDLFSCNAYFGEGSRPLATFVARKVRRRGAS